MHPLAPLVVPVCLLLSAALLSWALTGLVLRAFSSQRHQAMPNERTMHERPTPNVGGLAIVATVLGLGAISVLATPAAWALAGCVAVLSLISWTDQYRPLWPVTRFLVQALAVATALSVLPPDLRLIPNSPLWLERVAFGLAWMWMINLTNFIDGIDGIAATSGMLTALGYVAVALVPPLPWSLEVLRTLGAAPATVTIALLLAGACFGYLFWNWHPARIFMGDVGSIPLGFLLGWLLFDLLARGLWLPALILHAPYVADTTLTLLRRLLRGEKIWQAHRVHFYQRAVRGGHSPAVVVRRFAVAHLACIALALVARTHPLPAALGAFVVVLLLLVHLSRLASGSAPPNATAPHTPS